jgi:hypothetical protein
VHNLARSAAGRGARSLALRGWALQELFGRTLFPRIVELPYLLTLARSRVLVVPAATGAAIARREEVAHHCQGDGQQAAAAQALEGAERD